MALERPIRNMNYVFLCLNLWWITLKKRNTYGVETFILYYDSLFFVPKFMLDCAEKVQHLQRCFPQTIR